MCYSNFQLIKSSKMMVPSLRMSRYHIFTLVNNYRFASIPGIFLPYKRWNSSSSTSSFQMKEEYSPRDPLTDSFRRKHNYLRISLTEKCNLRCTYCMPEEGVPLSPRILTTSEIRKLADFFVSLGVNKIRLTGGEPTVRKDFFDVIDSLAELKNHGLKTLALTTNGVALNAAKLERLRDSGVDAVNISLDTLTPEKFEFITRRKGWHLVMRTLRDALNTGFRDRVKLNVVVMHGINDDEVVDFVSLTQDCDIDIRFIEYMPFDGNKWSSKKMMSFKEILHLINKTFPTIEPIYDENFSLRQTSKPYRIPGFKGRLGFITSMTDNFCSTCNRIRITADGHLKVCLFGNEEVSLREALSSDDCDERLRHIVSEALLHKRKQHAGSIQISQSINRPMILIGTSHQLQSLRQFSSFSHLSSDGEVNMVDVSTKSSSVRTAKAIGTVVVGRDIIQAIKEVSLKKGDVITTSKIAGILAAKRTSELIPLCHPINLSHIVIDVSLCEEGSSLTVECTVKTNDKTGVEMEALTGVTVACLTLYDMCKSLRKDIVIQEIKLVSKTGGKSGTFERSSHENK